MDYISSDEEFLEVLDYLMPEQRRNFRGRSNHLQELNDDEFVARYRVSKNTATYIAAE